MWGSGNVIGVANIYFGAQLLILESINEVSLQGWCRLPAGRDVRDALTPSAATTPSPSPTSPRRDQLAKLPPDGGP